MACASVLMLGCWCVQEKNPAVQKKAYKVFSYLASLRPDFVELHFEQLLDVAVTGAATAVSAAKRYRLNFLRAVMLSLVHQPDRLRSAEAQSALSSMVSEVVLSLKEANKKTRAEAYSLLVDLGRTMSAEMPVEGDCVGICPRQLALLALA